MAKNLPEFELLLKDVSTIELEELLDGESANNKRKYVNDKLKKKQSSPHSNVLLMRYIPPGYMCISVREDMSDTKSIIACISFEALHTVFPQSKRNPQFSHDAK